VHILLTAGKKVATLKVVELAILNRNPVFLAIYAVCFLTGPAIPKSEISF
jgi:hypothetical protein